ncbi:MAG: RNA polymerase sigma factor [Opitutaceae bacterium]|jgi:RNA polymerase sigma-70 factor (ECF subfamily)|nr:RNA polymerase sigma factor [Opitutaceae bacterium]
MTDDPDLPLVLALQNGDDLALNALMDRHREPLFRFVFRHAGNETVARDVAQEAFVRAYFNIGKFRPGPRFSTWLYRIALNLCHDHARSRHARRERLHQPLAEPGADTPDASARDPGEQAALSEELAAARAAIDKLPRRLREALLLTLAGERSHREAAELLEVSVKTVETRVHRARKLLDARLRSRR